VSSNPALSSGTTESRGHYLTHLRAMRSFFRRRAPGDEVDDLVQEVALRMESRRDGEAVANLQGYMFQVAQNVLTDRARRDRVRHRGQHDSLEDCHHPIEDRSPARVIEGKEQLARLLAALEDLPERTRHAFVLHRFEEMSYAGIASHLGISVSAVEKHIMKAIHTLAARVAE
jgi:RNA polymerase sigma factor (sigma-70 family)